jgi:Domain of unknown function DUF29
MMLYEQDFYQWTQEQTELMKAGALSQLDIPNLIEEIESMGKTQKHELINRLAVLLMHLLKWDYQPERRSRSWELTIKEQRIRIKNHLSENPSLKYSMSEYVSTAFEIAVVKALKETRLPDLVFPETCPYTIEQIMGTVT